MIQNQKRYQIKKLEAAIEKRGWDFKAELPDEIENAGRALAFFQQATGLEDPPVERLTFEDFKEQHNERTKQFEIEEHRTNYIYLFKIFPFFIINT